MAVKYDLYFVTNWFDFVSHTLGGIVVSGAFIYISQLQSRFPKEMPVLIFVLFIGAAWEFFELYMELIRTSAPGYFLDTAADLCFDIFGGHMSYLFARKNFYGR